MFSRQHQQHLPWFDQAQHAPLGLPQESLAAQNRAKLLRSIVPADLA